MIFERIRKNSVYFQKTAVAIGITVIIIMICLTIYNWPRCAEIKSVDMSVEVVGGDLRIIGLNADTDGLRFGRVSPWATVKRSVIVELSNMTKSTVVIGYLNGDLASWVNMNPQQFSLIVDRKQTVEFELNVPFDAIPRNYTGKALFCFK